MIKKLLIFIIGLFLVFPVFADEVITGFEEDDLPVLNEEFREIRQDIQTKVATGTYDGDGTISNEITGVGFAPKAIWIISSGTDELFFTTDTFVDNDPSGYCIKNGSVRTQNAIISLDDGGFTVDDAGTDSSPNIDGTSYDYLCIR